MRSDVRRRCAVAALALAGTASMAATALLQLGAIRDLPDPPVRWFGLPFDSRRVNLSDDAYVLGMRDGPVALVGFASTGAMAVLGASDRAERTPWLPIAFATKAMLEALGAAVFFSKMPRKEKAWCTYCITAAFASVAAFALSVPEALRAIARVRERRRAPLLGAPFGAPQPTPCSRSAERR